MVPAMAKMSTICERCDGKFDGTPSGWKKHEQTNKHNLSKPMTGDGLPDALRADDVIAETTFSVPEGASPKVRAVMSKALKDGMLGILAGDRTAVDVLVDIGEAGAEAAAEEQTSLKLADFDPWTLPGLPDDRRDVLAAAHAEVDPANADIAKYKRYVRHGELHNLKLLPKYQEQLASAQLRLAEANTVIANVEEERELLYGAHYDRVEAYWGRVHKEVWRIASEIDYMVAVGDLRVDRTEMLVDFQGSTIQVIGPRYHYGRAADWERVVHPAFVRVNSTFEGGDIDALAYGERIKAAAQYAVVLNQVLGLA